jgi:hypothetical protein
MTKQLPKELIPLIEQLDEDQLHFIYRLLAERLKLVHKARALLEMRKFNIMDRVSFTHNGKYYEGIVNRLNQKSITVLLDDGNRWNVSPGVLTKVEGEENPLKALLTKEQWQELQRRK